MKLVQNASKIYKPTIKSQAGKDKVDSLIGSYKLLYLVNY